MLAPLPAWTRVMRRLRTPAVAMMGQRGLQVRLLTECPVWGGTLLFRQKCDYSKFMPIVSGWGPKWNLGLQNQRGVHFLQ